MIKDSDAFELAVPLSKKNAKRIQSMTVTTSSVAINIQLNGYDVPIHLIGRRVSASEWAGTAVIAILDRDGKIQRFNRLCEEYTAKEKGRVRSLEALVRWNSPERGIELRVAVNVSAHQRVDPSSFLRKTAVDELERWLRAHQGL